MAQTQSQAYTALVGNYVNLAAAVGITIQPAQLGTAAQWSNPPFMSMYNVQGLFFWIVAGAVAITEQLWDAFTTYIQSLIATASPQTGAWFQAQMLKFQFDATTPQVVQFDPINFAPYYVTVDPTKQVIKYCSVVPGALGTTTIKVAADVGGFPAQIDDGSGGGAFPGSLPAAQAYVDLLGVTGITYNVISGNSDKIYIAASIYYIGLYSAVIQANVIAAINAYLASIPFNGVVTLSDLELAIKAVPGVSDIVFTNVQARADGTPYGSGTNLVAGVDGAVPSGNIIQRNWATVAGYVVGETTTSHTLADSLFFIAA